MRTIGLLLFLLFLSTPLTRKNDPITKTDTSFVFKIPHLAFSVTDQSTENINTIDTAALKQSAWYTNATRHIEESEYKISPLEVPGCFGSPNRQQNLRAFYTGSVFTLKPRENEDWKLELSLRGIYAGKKKIYSLQSNAIAITNKNKIQFTHNKEFTVEYINNKEGVRQNFIIEREPALQAKQLTVKLQASNGWFINKVNSKEIHFAKIKTDNIEKKITYNSLKAWDANNKELDASFSVYKNEISINVNTENAVYPITIDPLSTGTNGTVDWTGDDAGQPSGFFGYSVSSAGDVNGDGYSDVIIGCYGYDEAFTVNEGNAFIYHGSSTGLSSIPDAQLDDANQNGALFGRSVACAGDVNGDNYSDVIIGADGYDDGPGFANEGWAFIYYGSPTGLAGFYGSTLKDADQAAAQFGFSVAGAGDVNADGFSDVIVGAYVYDDGGPNEGKAFVYYGSASGLNTTAVSTPDDADQADAQFACTVASAGDVNGDGYSDIVIGAFLYDDAGADEGQAYVYYGSGAGLSSSPDRILSDANMGDAQFGFSVASAGDVNGDGYSDVIIGANEYDDGANANEGVAFIYYGSSTGLSATYNAIADDADQANANFGGRVACAGDVNGDGYSDVIIGAYTYDDNLINEGVAFVYYGSNSGLSASPVCMLDDANGPGASFGYSVASAGDVNGDGYSDVIIGAYTYNYLGNIDYGLTYVYHGSPTGVSTTAAVMEESNQANAYLGGFISSAGDVNADGYSDIILGAPFYDNGETDEGVAFVFHGSANGISTTYNTILESNQAFTSFGFGTAAAGDVNGDGYGDVIVGADHFVNGQSDEGVAFVFHGSASGINPIAAIMLEVNQAGAEFGYFVGAGGDVNCDGYSDVIVGAPFYDGGQTDEGAAFVFHGSSAGITSTIRTTLEVNQAFAHVGIAAASAGDVNGDGFTDVIVGANRYDSGETDEGAALIYHGSLTGIIPIVMSMLECNVASAYFGTIVSSAGDVNADGYCDVIVGAYQFTNGEANEGAVFIYHGSPGGILTTARTIIESNIAGAGLGVCATSAGDVNGDGYADIIAGAYQYSNGESAEGAAFIYYGSPGAVSATASAVLESNQTGAIMGLCVAPAGDVNGDGYSDVISAAPSYDNPDNSEGAVFIYMGNNGGGKRNNLRLYNSDLITPIQQSNMSDPNLFGAGLYAKSFIGKQKGKMVWETVRNGNPFTGSPITNSTTFTTQQTLLYDLGLTGTELKNQIAKMVPTRATYIRARVKYDLVTAITGQVYGPWRYPEGFMRGRRDIGSVALPVKFISFTATKENTSAKLKWITTEEQPGMKFEIQHSIDGINFTTLALINGKNELRNEYDWIHITPSKGNNFYRIKAVENDKPVFTPTRLINFDNNFTTTIYPNPALRGQQVTIKNENISKDRMIRISIYNMAGQVVWQKAVTAATDGIMSLDVSSLSTGAYVLQIETDLYNGKAKMIVEK